MTFKNMNKQNFKLRQICCFILLILFLLPASSYAAGTVSGTVFVGDCTVSNAALTTSVADVSFYPNCAGGPPTGVFQADTNGNFSGNLPAGNYYVHASPNSNTPPYLACLDQWYDGTGGADNCNSGATINVTDNLTTSNIDFTLAEGGIISGTVIQSAGSTSIADVCVQANASPACNYNAVSQAKTAANGYYSMAVPTGTYYINTSASCSGAQAFINEWWDGSAVNDTTDCNSALPVTVNQGGSVFIEFRLNYGTIISVTNTTGVTITWPITAGSYTTGSVIAIPVRFPQPVWVSGTPQLILAVNRTARTGKITAAIAEYSSGSGTDTLIFLYKVAAGDDISTLEYADLKLNGAQIQDINGNDVIPKLASPAPTPSVVNVTSPTESGTYPVGTAITINVRFSVLVWVKGVPQLVLNTGGAVPKAAYYSSGSGTNILTFLYTVAAGDNISSLDYWSEWALELNDGQIYSNLGMDADLDLPAPGASGSLGYNTALGVLGAYYPVYRFYSPVLSKYLFTIDENEKEYLIANAADVWQIEGSAYYAYLPSQYDGASRQQRNTLQAVYRFYSEALQTHLFTIDENEKEYLIADAADIWRYEGPAFYVPAGNPEGTIPVYRFYSEDLMVHLFTADENEKNQLIDTAGDIWNFEGVAYYAYP
ncbi:hypothetical protein QUF90_18330 [Desulfococcaceae bacterium HSG9]|nr:hypothetical protein [Desulfococcaceae bacterium HSG9]